MTADPVSIEQMFREATIHRYEHGGGRVYWEGPNGRRRLLLDLYGTDDDTGAVREYVLEKLGRPAADVPAESSLPGSTRPESKS